MGLNTFGSPRHLSRPWIQWNVQSKRNWCTSFGTKWSKPRANWMLENKILRLFGEPIKCLRMLQLYKKEVSNLYTIKELKGVAKMRSKMCSQRLQNSTKTSSPRSQLLKNPESKRGFGSLCIWPNSSTKMWKSVLGSTTLLQHPKNSNQICKRVKERNKTNYGKQTS